MFPGRYFAAHHFAPRYYAGTRGQLAGSAIWRLYQIGSKWVFSVGQT